MKTITTGLIVVALVIVGLSTDVQAHTVSWNIFNGGNGIFSDLVSPAFGNKYCPNAESPLTDTEIDQIVQIHNEIRQAVGTSALKWNCALADFAQKWANKDTFEHSAEKDRQNIIAGSLAGENLSNDSETNQIMQKMIQGWIDEKQFLNADKKTCTAGKVCEHYTQMVWKTSTEIGCGIFRRSNSLGADFKDKASYFVCIYNPGGNDGGAAY